MSETVENNVSALQTKLEIREEKLAKVLARYNNLRAIVAKGKREGETRRKAVLGHLVTRWAERDPKFRSQILLNFYSHPISSIDREPTISSVELFEGDRQKLRFYEKKRKEKPKKAAPSVEAEEPSSVS